MYADDLIILSASQSGLQAMLDICISTCENLSLKFNYKKLCCIYFGRECYQKFNDLMLGDETICWQSSINYLGVFLLSEKSLTVDICASKRKLFMSCNCILSNSSNLCELVQLHLQQTFHFLF